MVDNALSVCMGTGSTVVVQNNVTVFDSSYGDVRWSSVFNDNITVAGAHAASTIVGLTYDSVTSKSTLLGFSPASTEIFWIRPLGTSASDRPLSSLVVSDDGSVAAVSIVDPSGENQASLLWYNAHNGSFIGQWQGPANQTVYRLSVSGDGSLLAFMTQKSVYVIETSTRNVLFEQSVQGLSNAFCFSADGTYLAYGYSDFTLYQKSSTGTYIPQWTVAKGGSLGSVVASCATSEASTVVAWAREDFAQNYVEWYKNPSSNPVWTYTAPPTDGDLQDGLFAASITDDGTTAAFAGWGADDSTSPQIVVFSQAYGPVPQFSEVTAGSMLTVDVQKGSSGVHVVATGKHVHANQPGVGGNIYEIIV
eukprot:TRINITY_DN143_c0_g2_i1.p1 TRINITY_DN143_c0_g2~~TRINITY_DN143_c0_g2_i1.p1  ORF type:complete len:412 (-),score=80.26 TRINITY_DN143_c0_g2_i1:246-1337(-)